MNRSRVIDAAVSRRHWMAAAAAACTLGLQACSATQIRHSWSLPENARVPLRRLLVIGVSRLAAPRLAFEDAYVEALKAAGVDAVASHHLIPADGPQEPDTIAGTARNAGADGITVSLYLGEEKTVVRDNSRWERVDLIGPRRFAMAYPNAWVRVYEPVETEVVRAIGQTSVYRAFDGELLWSTITEAPRPSDIRAATRSFAKVAIAEMKRSRIV